MICRREADGWLLITQPAHAWLAGSLAEAWGSAALPRPEPSDAVVLATRLHDIGWLPWDAAPRLGDNGQPIGFLQTTLAETIPMWQRGVAQVQLIDPAAALLISLHASTIYRRRLERGLDPPAEQAQIAALLAEQAAWRAAQLDALPASGGGPLLTETALQRAYRWLRACDLLTLVALSDAFAASGEIPDVPGAAPEALVTLRYARIRPFVIQLAPYPFATPGLQRSLPARRLSGITFADEAAYHQALAAATWQQLTITYEPA